MAEFAGQWGPEGVEYPNGQHAANVVFEVRTNGGFLIPLFGDKLRSTTKPNPGQTDGLGNLFFFANPGSYILRVADEFDLPITVQIHPEEEVGQIGGPGGYKHTQAQSASQFSIAHGLAYAPAGILCLDNNGVQIDQDRVAHPAPGVTEIYFQAPFEFAGTVYLS